MEGNQFFALEEYLLETYLDEYAAKVSNLVNRLIHYFSSQIYIIDPSKIDDIFYTPYLGKDIRQESLAIIDNIIKHTIINDVSSLQVLIHNQDQYSLICINGEFSVDLYSGDEELIELVKTLVNHENLYLRRAEAE